MRQGLILAAAVVLSLQSGALLAQSKTPLGFFITSTGSGDGANLGGIAGADAICQKLAAAAGAGGLSSEAAADLHDAFEFIRYVRLLHQAKQIRSGEAPDNFVAPDELSSFEKRHLRDAFQIVRTAQQTLLQSHPLGHVT